MTADTHQPEVATSEVSLDRFQPFWAHTIKVLAALMSVFYLYSAGFGATNLHYHLGVYVLLTVALAFLIYPIKRNKKQTAPNFLDLILGGLAVI